MTSRATGSLIVTMTPAAPTERSGRTTLGRMLLDKQYDGDLVATGKGEMLTAVTDTQGAASYVAIEHVTGALNGRAGSFVLHHLGTMVGGVDQLEMAIVAESGTGELAGISGKFTIRVVDGKHLFELDYAQTL
ncbi:MAG TPA: DUF3224 domain-containing protein [Telluria sp.]|nr:DUF3224 domain-containing protein [Telluria sp.]